MDNYIRELGDAWTKHLLNKPGLVHDKDFYCFRKFFRRVHQIIDVGANMGQSIVSFRNLFPSSAIVAFEVNQLLNLYLLEIAAKAGGEIQVVSNGLGDEEGSFVLYTPQVGSQVFIQECSTQLDYYELPWVKEKFASRSAEANAPFIIKESICHIKTGDSYQLEPDIIKVDVEGAELKVIKGLQDTIQRTLPWILVENSRFWEVTDLLSGLGYIPTMYDEKSSSIVPLKGNSANTLYMTRDDYEVVTSL